MSEKTLSGMQKICKAFGQVKIGDTLWVWDYYNDEARKKSEMTKEEIALSNKAKFNPEYAKKTKDNYEKIKNEQHLKTH